MASASSTCTAQQHHHVHASHDVAADADFLEHMPVLELHRNNILKLETDELLKECRLDLQHTKWHKAAQRYLSELNTVLEDINRNISIKSDECPLPLDADKLPSSMTLDKAHLHVVLDKNVGITTRAGNAKDLPLLQCSIVLPNSLWKSKDYLHHRYFSVCSMSCVACNVVVLIVWLPCTSSQSLMILLHYTETKLDFLACP